MGLFVLNRKEYTSCHLEVASSLHADAGQYKVTLENKLGAASAAINVKVIGVFISQQLKPSQSSYTRLRMTLNHLSLPSGLPGTCKEIVASDITKSSCKVSWDPPDYDGGSPILHYVLQVRASSGSYP